MAGKRKALSTPGPSTNLKKQRTNDDGVLAGLPRPGPSKNLPNPPSKPAPKPDTGKMKGPSNDVSKQKQKQKAPPPSPPKHHTGKTINKLAPPRPVPKVPTSSNATGPYSARTEGKNYICVTRNITLGTYLRRCVGVVQTDG